MNQKKWYQSKTVIFGVLSVIAGMLMYFSGTVSGNSKDLIIAVVGVINIVLRFNTSQPVDKSLM